MSPFLATQVEPGARLGEPVKLPVECAEVFDRHGERLPLRGALRAFAARQEAAAGPALGQRLGLGSGASGFWKNLEKFRRSS
jgi:hypothetical protein